MTGQPTPEAVEAVARAFHVDKFPDHAHCDPNSVELMNAQRYVRLIRDAIHRDGPDADAIRQALGLKWDEFMGTPRQEPARRVVGDWEEVQP